MVQITGKYEPVENVNFYEFLLKAGIPEDKAKAGNESTKPYEIVQDGNKIRFISSLANKTTELVLGEEVDETLLSNITVKSTASLDGNVVTVKSRKPDDGSTGTRTLTFTDAGLELKINIEGFPEVKRIYKRI